MATVVLDQFLTEFRFIVSGAGQVQAELDRIDQRINRTVQSMGRGVLMWGTAFGFVGRAVSNLDKQIIGIATQSRISTDAMWKHYDAIREVGKAYSVSGKQMLEAFQEVVELTGDAELALQQSPLLAQMIRGGKMKPVDAGSLVAAFRDLKVNRSEFGELADALTHISKLGSIPIHKIGGLIPRVAGLYTTTGAQGQSGIKDAIIDIAAALQIGNRIMRSPKRAVTAMENFINDYSDKLDEINALTGEAFTGNEGFIPIMESLLRAFSESGDVGSLADIFGVNKSDMKDAKNILTEAGDIFGRRGIRQFAAMNLGFADLNEFVESVNDSIGTLERDTAEYWGTTTGQIEQMKIALDGMVLSLSQSGGLLEVFNLTVDLLQAFGSAVAFIPSEVWKIALLFIFWKKVIIGLLLNALRPLYFTIGKQIPIAMGAYSSAIARGIGITGGFKAALTSLKAVMLTNPFTFWITALLQLIPIIMIAWNGLKRIFGLKDKPSFAMKVLGEDMLISRPLLTASSVSPIAAGGGTTIVQNNTVHAEHITEENAGDVSNEIVNMISDGVEYFSNA
jgi:TP901 family phage tail tape measure protein